MAVTGASAAKYLCGLSGWSLTNLKLQKLLYIAQMFYAGHNNGSALVDENFEAWDYGPVLPSVYHQVKMFGSDPIQDVFYSRVDINNTPEADMLEQTWNTAGKKSARDLVAISHWKDGAWAKNYRQGARGREIPLSDLVAEYNSRVERFKADKQLD